MPPREKLTTRAGRWATRQGGLGRPLGEIADELGCSWHPVNSSVRRWGEALIDADTERIACTEALGLDEKHDPLYRARKLLVSASERITDAGRVRLRGPLDAGDPYGEVRDARHR